MTPHTFIFIGRSGCGKDTQAELLTKELEKRDPSTTLFHLEPGARFREFIKEKGYTNELAQAVSVAGHRQPDFLAVWMWSHLLVENFTGKEHLLSNGTPRSECEARVLDTALKFYDRRSPYVIHLDVSRGWSEQKLLARGRADDSRPDIKARLDWFEKDVIPAIEFFEKDPFYRYVKIDGEKSIEEVRESIMASLDLS
jgi:adenylate kinase family enzyme